MLSEEVVERREGEGELGSEKNRGDSPSPNPNPKPNSDLKHSSSSSLSSSDGLNCSSGDLDIDELIIQKMKEKRESRELEIKEDEAPLGVYEYATPAIITHKFSDIMEEEEREASDEDPKVDIDIYKDNAEESDEEMFPTYTGEEGETGSFVVKSNTSQISDSGAQNPNLDGWSLSLEMGEETKAHLIIDKDDMQLPFDTDFTELDRGTVYIHPDNTEDTEYGGFSAQLYSGAEGLKLSSSSSSSNELGTEDDTSPSPLHEDELFDKKFFFEQEEEALDELEEEARIGVIKLREEKGADLDERKVEELWKNYVDEAYKNLTEKKKGHKHNISLYNENKFLRQVITKKTEITVPRLTREDQDMRFPLTLIYSFLLLNYKIHKTVVSDYSLKKAQNHYGNLLNKKTFELEANLVLGKINFYLGKYEHSVNHFNKAIHYDKKDLNKGKLWKGLSHLFLFLTSVKTEEIKKHSKEAEKTLIEYVHRQTDIIAFFALLHLTLRMKTLKLKSKYDPERYALNIKSSNPYLGYIAWSEIYFNDIREEKRNLGMQVLRDLIAQNPSKPEAYLRLWSYYWKKADYQRSMEVAEKVFIYGTEFESNEMKLIIMEIYAKSLLKVQENIRAFELWQHLYSVHTSMPIMLYKYAKAVYNAKSSGFYGSALSALEECERTMVPSRLHTIYYLKGCLYFERRYMIQCFQQFSKTLTCIPRNKQQRIKKATDIINNGKRTHEIQRKIEEFKTLKGRAKNDKNIKSEDIQTLQKRDVPNLLDQTEVVVQLDRFYGLFLKAQIHYYIETDVHKASKAFEDLIASIPDRIEAHIEYAGILKRAKNFGKMLIVSSKMIQSCQSPEIPMSLWVEAHKIHAKSLLCSGYKKEAIKTLQQLCHILPPLPIPDLNFINQAVEIHNPFDENGDIEEEDEEEEKVPPVGGNSFIGIGEGGGIGNELVVEGEKPGQTGSFLSAAKYRGSKRNNSLYESFDKGDSTTANKVLFVHFTESKDKRHRSSLPSFGQKPAFLNMERGNSAETAPNYSSEGFAVTTDASFLYVLGKLAIKTKYNIKLGLDAMCDYILILNCFKSDLSQKQFEKQELKAKYWIGLALFGGSAFDEAVVILTEIVPKLYEKGLTKKKLFVENILAERMKAIFNIGLDLKEDYFYPEIRNGLLPS